MIEVFPGSGVYWYVGNKQCVQATAQNGTQLVSTMVDVFFSHEVLKTSNLEGGGTKSYKKLDLSIMSAIQCKLYYYNHTAS